MTMKTTLSKVYTHRRKSDSRYCSRYRNSTKPNYRRVIRLSRYDNCIMWRLTVLYVFRLD